MRVACSLTLSEADRHQLQKWARGRKSPVRRVQRAQIVLLAAAGMMNKDIAVQVGTDRRTVARWRNRFAVQGLVFS